MAVVGGEYRGTGLRPRGRDPLDDPCGVRGARRQLRVHPPEQSAALGDEPAQHRIGETRGTLGAEEPRGVDRRVNGRLRAVARILDLVGRDREKGADRARNACGVFQQQIESGRETQVPADRAERDRANRRTVSVALVCGERGFRGSAARDHLIDRPGGRSQCRGAGRPRRPDRRFCGVADRRPREIARLASQGAAPRGAYRGHSPGRSRAAGPASAPRAPGVAPHRTVRARNHPIRR